VGCRWTEVPAEGDCGRREVRLRGLLGASSSDVAFIRTSGAILGVFAQSRASTETVIEEAILGKSVADLSQALELYNASVKK
jgi:hypothetical protein